MGVMSVIVVLISHSFRSPPVYFVHLPFTFYACGFLVSNWVSRAKTPLCVTTILVRVVTLFASVARFRVSALRVIATFSPRFSCIVGSVCSCDFSLYATLD